MNLELFNKPENNNNNKSNCKTDFTASVTVGKTEMKKTHIIQQFQSSVDFLNSLDLQLLSSFLKHDVYTETDL